MHWIVPASFVALTYALQGIIAKAIFRRTALHESGLLFLSFLLAIPLLAPLALSTPFPPPDRTFLLALTADILLNLIAFTAFYGAIRRTDLSIAMPLVALTPVYMLLTSWWILGEASTPAGWAGVFLAGSGCYLLGASGARTPLDPLRRIAGDPGARLAFLTGIIWSVTANLEKLAVLHSSPLWFPLLFQLGFCLAYLPVWLHLPRTDRRPDTPAAWVWVTLHAAVGVAMAVTQMSVLQWTLAQYVIVIKRAGILLSVLAGIFWFGEIQGGLRLVASLVILAGVALILVSSRVV